LDENNNFYFLDEYAFASGTSVTEWITGTDLVELQIKVQERKLAIKQEDLKIRTCDGIACVCEDP
jgi:propionyl-CoA carboxylase alpha chain